MSEALKSLDAEIGGRLRRLRMAAGLTQGELGAVAGVSYQMVHKYESGENRVSAATLRRFARHLAVPIAEFFDADDAGALSCDPDALRCAGLISRLPAKHRALAVRIVEEIASAAAARPADPVAP